MKLIKMLLRIALLAATIIYLIFTVLTFWSWGELGTEAYIPIYTFIFGQFTSAMILAFLAGYSYLFGEKKLTFMSTEFRIFMTSVVALLVYVLSVLITR